MPALIGDHRPRRFFFLLFFLTLISPSFVSARTRGVRPFPRGRMGTRGCSEGEKLGIAFGKRGHGAALKKQSIDRAFDLLFYSTSSTPLDSKKKNRSKPPTSRSARASQNLSKQSLASATLLLLLRRKR